MLDFMFEWFCITWHDQIHEVGSMLSIAFVVPPCLFSSTSFYLAVVLRKDSAAVVVEFCCRKKDDAVSLDFP